MSAKHPPNPSCDCDDCFVADLNAVLRRFVEQREARKVDAQNAAVIRDNHEREQWRDTFVEGQQI